MLITVGLFLVTSSKSYSQNQNSMAELIQASELIAEGTILSDTSFWNKEKTMIYTLSSIKIKTLFKGIEEDSVISIVTRGGIVGNDLIKTSHMEIDGQKNGLFFLNKRSNNIKSCIYNEYESSIIGQSFVWIHDIDKHPFYVYNEKRISKKDFEENILVETRQPSYYPSQSNKLANKIPCKILPTNLSPIISFSFNQVQFSDDSQNINFNIQVSTDMAYFQFGKGEIVLTFAEDNPFGSFLVKNKLLQIEQTSISDSEIYNLEIKDLNANSIKISVFPKSDKPENLTKLISIKEDFLKVKLKITNPKALMKMSFDNIAMNGSCYYYCSGSFAPYQNVKTSKSIASVIPPANLQIPITYTFENLKQESLNNNDFLTFDIFAKAEQQTFFKSARILVEYDDKIVFQSNQVLKNFIIINTGISILNNYKVDYDDYFLSANNVIEFVVDPINNSNLILLDKIPIKLFTIKLRYLTINSCKIPPNLLFKQIEMQNLSTYQIANGPFMSLNYTPVIANDVEKTFFCGCPDKETKINSFFPKKIPAGTGDILTIEGENFGYDVGFIKFPNADDGGQSTMRTNRTDLTWNGIVHWTDTEIQVKVPSTDYTSQFGDRPAGSGDFEVITAVCGKSIKSPESLHIPYALTNIRNKSQIALPVGLACKNKFSLSTANSSTTNDQFQKALNKWNTVTNLNFTAMNHNTTVIANATDGINAVFETTSGGAAMSSSIAHYEICGNSGYLLKDIDISGNPSAFISQEAYYEAVFIHELGHAQGLSHSLHKPVDEDLMYYSKNLFNGVVINNDIDVVISSQLITTTSANIVNQNQCNSQTQPIIIGGLCSTTNVNDYDFKGTLSVFPNPISSNYKEINVSYNGNFGYTIYDILGREITFQKNISDKTSINLERLSSGAYLLKVQDTITKQFFNYKFIIQ